MTTTTANTTRDRLGSDGKRGLSLLLAAATNGACSFCGSPDGAVACHIVPAASFEGNRAGYVSGNLAWGCTRCNDLHGKRDLTAIVPLMITAPPAWTEAEVRRIGRANTPAVKITDAFEATRQALYANL